MACKHFWFQIESDFFGKPVKYCCKYCGTIYEIKPEKIIQEYKEYFNGINSIKNRIVENTQKILLLELRKPLNQFDKLHVNHLQNENKTFNKLLNQKIFNSD